MKRLELRISASPLHHARIGLIVPKYGHSSVDRNRLKRWLREIIRQELLHILPAIDAVIRVLPASYHVGYGDLLSELRAATVYVAGSVE